MHSFNQWCIRNKLTINIKKCNYIVLKNAQNRFNFNHGSVMLGNEILSQSSSLSFLGVTLDPQLNWSNHVSNLLKSLRPFSGLFFRLAKHLPKDILVLLYHLHSKINYCLDCYGNAPSTHINKITLFQKTIVRIINNKKFDHPSNQLFKQCKILNIVNAYKLKVLLNAHDHFYSSSRPIYPHSYSTRHSTYKLPIPLFTSSSGQRSPIFQQVKFWNGLPLYLRFIKNRLHFKSNVKDYLLSL